MALTYGDSVADATLAALTPAGLVSAGSGQHGDLTDNPGKSLTLVAYTITARDEGQTFDPRYIAAGFLRDINGTLYETPDRIGVEYRPDYVPNMTPLLGSPAPLSTFNGSLRVLASQAAAFRLYIANSSEIDVIVTASYVQA
jgi:hypothetical protein